MIAEIHSLAEYEAELAKPGLAVLDFYAPHSRSLKTRAAYASTRYTASMFLCMPVLMQVLQVNGVDEEGAEVQKKAEVTWWPTLVVYKDGKEIWRDRVPNPPSRKPLESLEYYLKTVVA
ncbi:unnamed protein product [Aspergillus oryzae]|uniref:Unnamed protein product n=2 Tax=Aspergillus oryzae TaxID=5062 RepID=A0AAN4YN66_ASPOZ|nr:unnamed protein product [Aspergillus oryzae]GMF96802.1 unnamed protein product [Aspergillus oryzae]GMG13171.1 unnamed protein product [Aspergillus oryzae]GMG30467.1 unnamed protein product [Aspergillus oryzae]GMG52811.1 unnamed protein product [Aspergillus oryzae var. brunneus]